MSEQVKLSNLPLWPSIRFNPKLMTVQSLLAEGPEKWTKGAKYRDASGVPIEISDAGEPTPASFDLIGAIDYVYHSLEDNQAARIRVGMLLKTSLARWNDAPSTSYEDVMALVRKANI